MQKLKELAMKAIDKPLNFRIINIEKVNKEKQQLELQLDAAQRKCLQLEKDYKQLAHFHEKKKAEILEVLNPKVQSINQI